jgi:predicted dehydrogenase
MPGSHAASYACIPNVRVVAICDIVQELMDKFVATWGATWGPIATYTDYREMLVREHLDIISVVTSDHRHADIVVDAAEAGVRGVFCEKPIATSLADADRMTEACERRGIPLSIDHTRRWYPEYHNVRNLLRSGMIGTLRRIVATMGGPRAMLFRNGTHLIDMICFLAESDPAWVFAELDDEFADYGAAYRGDGGRDPATDPGGSGYIHFKNGVRAFCNASKGTPGGSSFDLLGTEGRIFINDTEARLWTVDSSSKALVERPLRAGSQMKTGILAAIEELINWIENGERGVSPGREARKTLEIILGMLASQARGNVRVDLPL